MNRSHADQRAAAFVDLVRRHDHEAYAVDEAAAALGCTRQYLRRLSLRWFGHAPGTVIALARLESVRQAILRTTDSIALISTRHSFRDAANLSRQFLRFVGVRPGALRRL